MKTIINDLENGLVTLRTEGPVKAFKNEYNLCKKRAHDKVNLRRKEKGAALKEELLNVVITILQYIPLAAFIAAVIAAGIAWANGKTSEIFK